MPPPPCNIQDTLKGPRSTDEDTGPVPGAGICAIPKLSNQQSRPEKKKDVYLEGSWDQSLK